MPAAVPSADVRAALPTVVIGTIYPQIGGFVPLPPADWRIGPRLQSAALTYLDMRDHPGTPEALVVAAATGRVRALGGSLSEAEMRAILTVAGWPVELHDAALRVAWCESKWSPYAVGDGGHSLGAFQLNKDTWFSYAGEDPAQWADPLTNARVAWATYQYDIARGYTPFNQWSCKP